MWSYFFFFVGTISAAALVGRAFQLEKLWVKFNRQGGSEAEYEARAIRRKQRELTQLGLLIFLLFIGLSVLLGIGPDGVEAVRYFLAPRIVVVPG